MKRWGSGGEQQGERAAEDKWECDNNRKEPFLILYLWAYRVYCVVKENAEEIISFFNH